MRFHYRELQPWGRSWMRNWILSNRKSQSVFWTSVFQQQERVGPLPVPYFVSAPCVCCMHVWVCIVCMYGWVHICSNTTACFVLTIHPIRSKVSLLFTSSNTRQPSSYIPGSLLPHIFIRMWGLQCTSPYPALYVCWGFQLTFCHCATGTLCMTPFP